MDKEQVRSPEEVFLENSKRLLRGLNMAGMDFSHSTLADIGFDGCQLYSGDFSNCFLNKIIFENVSLSMTNFSNSQFKNSSISHCRLYKTNFSDIDFTNSTMGLNSIEQGILMPKKLEAIINQHDRGLINPLNKVYLTSAIEGLRSTLEDSFLPLFSLLTAINKKNKIKIEDVKDLFIFENLDYQTAFVKKLEEILS